MHQFKTKLFGLTVDVIGFFEKAEPQTTTDPAIPAAFVIEVIRHADEFLEVCGLPEGDLMRIESAAFKSINED